MMDLREIMFRTVYTNELAKKEESKAISMLENLFAYYMDHPEKMSKEYKELIWKKGQEKERVVCDYLSGMTDQYSMAKFREINIPKSWEVY